VAKVSQSRVDIPKPKPVAPVSSAAGAARIRQQRVPGLSNVRFVDVDSNDDEEESERVGSEVGVDEKVDVSSSDGSSGRGDDDNGDEEHGEEIDRRWVVSEEFGQDGEGLGAEVDVDHEAV
jgi:hypothetical protein